MEFAKTLSSIMESKGITNYRIAKMIDVSQSTVAAWVSGTSTPRRSTMKQLAEALGVSVEYLQGIETNESVNELQNLRDEDRALLDVARGMSAEQVRKMTEFAKMLKGE